MYEDSPGQLIHDLFNQLLWPDHPLGRLLSGTIDSMRRITRKDVMHYWKRMYQPRSLLISCAGALTPESLVQQVRRELGALRPLPVRRFARAPRP